MAQMKKIQLKNVRWNEGEPRDIEVQLVPFSDRNDDHVEFVYAVSDMLNRLPSTYSDVNEASKRFVELFMVHAEEDSRSTESNYYNVMRDLRATRTLFNDSDFQQQMHGFFVNA